jgi:Zn-dependent peptidase ImmA (M78 family)
MALTKQDRAEQILAEHSIKRPPVDVELLAGRLGSEIAYESLESSVSGMLVRPPKGRPIVVVNDRHPVVRQRFTIAHELGHLELHKGRPVIVDHLTRARVNLRDETSSLATSTEEIAANQFAASLLMPGEWIHDAIDASMGRLSSSRLIDELATQFGVSAQAMEFRLINLGLRAAP